MSTDDAGKKLEAAVKASKKEKLKIKMSGFICASDGHAYDIM